MGLSVDFCGELHRLDPERPFVVGREGDVVVDADNLFLHRSFLQIVWSDGLWWLINVGSQLAATVSDGAGTVQAWLAPGARLPVVFSLTVVRFTAGPSTYEIELVQDAPPFEAPTEVVDATGDATIGMITFTEDQKLLVVALAEPLLRQSGRGAASLPTSQEAARRLGWTLTKFNRKVDNVCQKLAKIGVRGLHGGPGELASGRRARLVEYAVSVRLVTPNDLALLD